MKLVKKKVLKKVSKEDTPTEKFPAKKTLTKESPTEETLKRKPQRQKH